MSDYIEKKIRIAREKINEGEREGSFEFKTIRDLAGYLGVTDTTYRRSKKKILDAGFCFSTPLTEVEQKIQAAKEKIKEGDRGGSFEFETIMDLSAYIGIGRVSYRKYKEKLHDAGFCVESFSIRSILLAAKKRIEANDRDGSFVFDTVKELCSYLGIGETSYYRHKKIIEGMGLHVELLTIGERVQIAKDKIDGGERGGSFEFETVKELCLYLKIGLTTYRRHAGMINTEGFCVRAFTVEERIRIAKDKIDGGERGGSSEFETRLKLMEFLGVSGTFYYDHREKICNAGFQVKNFTANEKIQDAVDRINGGNRDEGFEFDIVRELFEYIGITETTYYRNQQAISDAGFSVKSARTIETIMRDAKERIRAGEREGGFSFKSKKELIDFLKIKRGTYSKYRELIREEGFIVGAPAISKNTQFSLNDCRSYGIKMENIELLPQLSQEFFSRHIRPDSVGLNAWDGLEEEVVSNFSKKEIEDKVKAAVLDLISESKADYSILELKLELFNKGVYFGEDSILSALLALGELSNASFDDNIYKRLRLCASFVEKGFIGIEYVKDLPSINSSKNGTVIIDRYIKSRGEFLRLWKEYVLFSVKNQITGYVTKSILPNDWEGDLDKLFREYPSFQGAYFLDSRGVKLLERLGYEGILAMCQIGSKQSKEALPKKYHSIHARCIGFFLYLNRKKLALFHPRYFIFTGASSVSDTAKKILQDHVVLKGFEKVLQLPDIPKSDLEKLKKKNVLLHGLKLSGSVLEGCDLQAIASSDIYSYLEHSSHELISGTIQHETFVLTLLRLLGNRGAIERDKVFNIEEEIRRRLAVSEASKSTLLNYKELLDEMLDVVRHFLKSGKSHGYVKSYLSHISNLMEYLSIFPKKLNRKEISAVLNTITASKEMKSFEEWSKEKERISSSEYCTFTQRMYMLFESITGEKYAKLYNKEWRIYKNLDRERVLIREGLEPVVYETLQSVALHDAPSAYDYPFYKTTPDGQIVDLSWWKYDFSPIPVICHWLVVKTTRRKISIRHLDVNTFLQYDESGQIKSFFINTDKNRNSSEREISIHLLRFIFTDDELRLLEKYVEYIKCVYSNMSKVSFSSSTNSYDDIMPLFPHHTKNAVISERWLDGYHNKTMLKTEFLVKKYVANGEYDRYFEEHEREAKKKMLSKTKLLYVSGATSKKLPESPGDLDQYSLAAYGRKFTTVQGVHNMRHAGISALGAKLPLVYVRIIAGHSDINTTARVYLHANEGIIGKEVLDAEFGSLSEPAKAGSSFVDKVIMPLAESNDPKMIENELSVNNFMSCPREITLGGAMEWVENGVELASVVHPATWKKHNYGVCPNAQCPLESRGCCGLCPYLIYSPIHLKGVVFMLNECLLEIAFLAQKIALDTIKNTNTSREELSQDHQQKITEMVGWIQVKDSIIENIKSGNNSGDNALSSAGEVGNVGNIVSFRSCSIDKSMVEQLVDAAELKINNVDTDNYIARISNKMLRKAIRDYDPDTMKRIEMEGIKWFIDEYGKKAFNEKKEYLLRYVNPDKPADDSRVLGSNVNTVELLPVG